jgi:MFS transporter, BCD family, chlorophyll transporter
MGVGQTTWLTAALAAGGLAGFSLASNILGRGFDAARLARWGAWIGLPAFAAVLGAAGSQSVALFGAGVVMVGFGAGLFGHGTLTLTMNRAPREQAGLALGAWGAVQATAAGAAVAFGGIGRDLVDALARREVFGPALVSPATGYAFIYAVEMVLLVATVVAMGKLVAQQKHPASSPNPVLRSAP